MIALIKQGYKQRYHRYIFAICALLVLLFILAFLMMKLGNTHYSLNEIIRVLLGESIQGASFAIMNIRLPRMLGALLVGMAFGIAGNTFQKMLRNPLASPDIIGVTSGSSVAAIFCILILGMQGPAVSIISVLSGLLVATLLYILAKGDGFSGGRLILIGIGIQTMLSALISYILMRASQYDVPAALRWLSGSLNGIQMQQLWALAIVVIVSGSIILVLGRHLNMLELGEESAITLGVDTDRTRLLLILCAVFLLAFATSISGPVAFVAFLSGPIAIKLVGAGAPSGFASAMVGACLVMGADLLGQFAFGTRFPVGVITGIIGAPYLLILLIKANKAGGF